jgi:hypothetical protein
MFLDDYMVRYVVIAAFVQFCHQEQARDPQWDRTGP